MMERRELEAERAVARQLQLRRRVKRGVVAGYIHELSARHQNGAARKPERRDAVLASPRSP
jgi:hypothetical protein